MIVFNKIITNLNFRSSVLLLFNCKLGLFNFIPFKQGLKCNSLALRYNAHHLWRFSFFKYASLTVLQIRKDSSNFTCKNCYVWIVSHSYFFFFFPILNDVGKLFLNNWHAFTSSFFSNSAN